MISNDRARLRFHPPSAAPRRVRPAGDRRRGIGGRMRSKERSRIRPSSRCAPNEAQRIGFGRASANVVSEALARLPSRPRRRRATGSARIELEGRGRRSAAAGATIAGGSDFAACARLCGALVPRRAIAHSHVAGRQRRAVVKLDYVTRELERGGEKAGSGIALVLQRQAFRPRRIF